MLAGCRTKLIIISVYLSNSKGWENVDVILLRLESSYSGIDQDPGEKAKTFKREAQILTPYPTQSDFHQRATTSQHPIPSQQRIHIGGYKTRE